MPTTFFGWVSFLIERYGSLYLKGTANTILVAITGTIIGFAIGLLVAVVRTIPLRDEFGIVKKVMIKIARALLVIYIEVFRGTPMIVQAMVIFYGAQQYLGLDMPVTTAAIFIISINTGAYMAEIIRGGIISVDIGQTEGAHSLGMTHWQTMSNVVLPQAIRNIMPSIGNEFVINIKDSSVLNVISVFIAAVIYLMLTLTTTRILRYVEKKMDGPENYTMLPCLHADISVLAKRKPSLYSHKGKGGGN